jgi:hypothetical protein
VVPLVRVRELIARLAELRARDLRFERFGAGAHHYVARPADEPTVLRFERRHRARLPGAFRQLLLEVIDGGAGPGYGLFPLERPADDGLLEDLALLGRRFDHDEYFDLQPPDFGPDDDEESRDAAMHVYWRDLPGTMTLCNYGCGIRAQLIVTGSLAGQVIVDHRCDSVGVYPFTRARSGWLHAPERAPSEDTSPLDVIAWYRDWLDAALTPARS